jgi:phage baseplate assembly protein V
MFQADTHIGRNVIRRVEIVEVDDRGTQQRAIVRGLADEEMKLAYRGQYFGETGNPPPGSDGFALLVGGRPDQAVLLGIEHKDHRVRDLKPGEKAIYDAQGQIIKLVGSGGTLEINFKTGGKMVLDAGQVVSIKAPSLTIEADITITGDINLTGNIQQTGSISSSGAHEAAAHV